MSTVHTVSKTSSHTNDSLQTSQQVHSEDAENFSQKVHEQEQNTGQEKSSSSHKRTPGDAILQGLLQPKNNESIQMLTNVDTVHAPKISEDSLQKLVNSILVSNKENTQEVHIRVNQSVLADTNIVVRMEEGNLFVQLHTGNAQSALTLHQNAQELENRLRNCCKDTEVHIKITENKESSQNTEQNSSEQQQSRGYFLWNKQNEG